MTPDTKLDPNDPEVWRYDVLLRRFIACIDAQERLIPYARLLSPTPEEPDDPEYSTYDAQRFHQVIAAALEEIEVGRFKRLIITVPPRHGKSLLAAKMFISWYAGRNPYSSVIFGTYNDNFAEDTGRAVRDLMTHPAHKQVFPLSRLKDDSLAASRLQTSDGGILAFVGRGGTTTGRGADVFVIDDPIKDAAEANSPTIRESCWTWFNRVVSTRLMTKAGGIVIIMTRWHEDDLVGRLIDPLNDFYDADEAVQWKLIDLPALALEDDALKRKPGEALWPQRFDADYFTGLQRRDPQGFSALYQGRPSTEGGTFFKHNHITLYKKQDLPKDLRRYCASDHAVSMLQGRDRTCLLTVGVDEEDDIWVIDAIWRQMPSDKAVENMLAIMREHKPLFWWAERSQISKSLGPFLRKRMLETQTFASIIEVVPIADKQTRAQSIQARMSMHKVHFPENAPWWPMARDEILRFPHGQHDDFVDALALIGLGLQQLIPLRAPMAATRNKPLTFGWIKEQQAAQRKLKRVSFASEGW